MGAKRAHSFLCLLGLLIWMDGGRTSPSVRVYNLPSLVDDLRIVAGVVTGVAVAHQIQNGSLGKDELVGEMCLGPNRKMSSLATVNASELSMDLEEIGRIVTEECGDKCDSVADNIIESGNKVLEVFNLLLTEDQKSLLKDTNAFENITTLQTHFRSVVYSEVLHPLSGFLRRKNFPTEAGIIASLSEFNLIMTEVVKLGPSIDYIEKHKSLLNQTNRDPLTKRIDTLLSLESNHSKIIEEMRLFSTLESQLTEFDKKTASLGSVLTSETVDRIERTLERMLPIVTSSGRSSKHPLRLLVSDFDSTIEGFQKKFLKNANSLSLKPFLKPIEKLIRDVNPLLTSWESEHFDEAVDDTINNFTRNLNTSLSQIASFSAFIPPLYQCIKNVLVERFEFSFGNLKTLRRIIEFVEEDCLEVFEPFKTSFEGLHTARKLLEFSNRSETEIREDLENIPNVTVAMGELKNFEDKLADFSHSKHISDFSVYSGVIEAFSDLQLTPIVNALDSLKRDNVLSKPWDPIGIESFGSIKSGSAEVEAIISAAKAVQRQSEEWKKNEKTTTTNSRRRRSGDESTTPWISDEMAKKFASGTKVIIDFGQVYEARDHLVTLSSLADTVNREVGALNDTKAQKRIAKVWNSDVQRMLAELPEAVQVLNRSLSKVPRSLVDFSTAFDFAQLPDFAKIDTRALRKALRFFSNGDVQKSLKTIGSLDLDFVDSFRRLEGAREALTHMLISLRKLRKSVGMRGKRDTSHMSHLEDFQPERKLGRFSCTISKSFESTDEDDSCSERNPDVFHPNGRIHHLKRAEVTETS